ncbi:Mannose-6-phosphate isomerase [Dinochytrium kinnereticum]|nr:Mannose-6-phosphate isomerase [Dinochytrium kinnereticum]
MHRIKYTTQGYDWGKLGSGSKVAEFAASDPVFAVDESKPYAELWMGTHPSGPSMLYDKPGTTLKSVLTEKNLSPEISKRYEGDIPFLFKILSIRKALSIQAHPDKVLAKELFEKFPTVYKDGNHKPEMAIALTPFEAFIGFRPLAEISHHLQTHPELRTLLDASTVTAFTTHVSTSTTPTPDLDKIHLKSLFKSLMETEQSKVAEHVRKLVGRLRSLGVESLKKGTVEEIVVRLDEQFRDDVGVFCAFFLNYVELGVGEAIFLAANEPHAYLSGDCVECMAASDNVVRSGLTPKHKDVETLLRMLTYKSGPASSQILLGESFRSCRFSKLYDPPIEEFSIVRLEIPAGEVEVHGGVRGPSVVIVTGGRGVAVVDGRRVEIGKGFAFFLEAEVELMVEAGEAGVSAYRAFCTL